jgi:methylmalonyl-CoA/ethylmalonyl-CoA epimerase
MSRLRKGNNVRPVDLFGEDAEFDHIGLVVDSIDALGSDFPRTSDPRQDVTVAFFEIHGIRIEAVAPNSENSPVSRQAKAGQKLLHLCYRVGNLETACENAKRHGLFQISAPVPADAFEGRRIVWLYSKVFGLFELTEYPGSESLHVDEDS